LLTYCLIASVSVTTLLQVDAELTGLLNSVKSLLQHQQLWNKLQSQISGPIQNVLTRKIPRNPLSRQICVISCGTSCTPQ